MIREKKMPARLYVQNNTELHIEYIEGLEDEKSEGNADEYFKSLEPTNSFSIPINSVSWSGDLEAQD